MGAARTREKEYDNGNHRHLHLHRKRLHSHTRPQRQGPHRSGRETSDNGPQFRLYAGNVELGAAWQKISGEGRDYLSVKLDDPSFRAPIHATLTELEGEDRLSS